MEPLLKAFVMPNDTQMEERAIKVNGDVIIGNHAEIGYGLLARSIIAGERVKIGGNIMAKDDIRLDLWSDINGDVKTKKNAYLGERVNINGKLVVRGDLDIGNEVHIENGFEARGWIVIRNPVPVIVYLFLYLAELLRLGKNEEVEKVLNEMFEGDEDMFNEQAMIIPAGTKMDLDMIRIPGRAIIGSGCRILGNVRANSLKIGENTVLFGSIRARDMIQVGKNSEIHGDLITGGAVYVDRGGHVMGEINADTITIHEEARVDGAMRALKGVILTREEEKPEKEEAFIHLDV